MSSKILMTVCLCLAYFLYSIVSDLRSNYNQMQKDMDNIMVYVNMFNDREKITQRELNKSRSFINKQRLNFEAFNGTACMTCHLESHLMLPLTDKLLPNLSSYIDTVRNGIPEIMPSYTGTGNKGLRDITDSELRRQYKILKQFTAIK